MSKEIIEKIKLAKDLAQNAGELKDIAFQVLLEYFLASKKSSRASLVKKEKVKQKLRKGKGASKPNWSERIDDLIKKGFFNEPKTNDDIINQLKVLGYKMQRTSLSSYLLPRVRDGILVRKKIDRGSGKIYGYIIKEKSEGSNQ